MVCRIHTLPFPPAVLAINMGAAVGRPAWILLAMEESALMLENASSHPDLNTPENP
jgi:hypothetical protein